MNRIILPAAVTLLFLLSFTCQAQLRIKENRHAKYDSVLIHLPHQTRMILVVDDINKLRHLSEINLDSLIGQLNNQLLTAQPLEADSARTKVKASFNEGYQFGEKRTLAGGSVSFFVWTGLGAGMVGKNFVPHFAPLLSMRRNDREYAVGMDFLFRVRNLNDFEEKAKAVSVQSYINLGYGFKPGDKTDEASYHRVFFGYLIPTSTYDKWRPSFKISYLFPIPKTSVKLVPEVYFNNAYSIIEFSSVRPGLSIRF